jgi:hypothetical protein
VLVRVELTPLSKSRRGRWKDTCEKSLELLRRCIYVDKDLVLPPTGASSPIETFFVIASTDMEKVKIMTERIQTHVGALPQLKTAGTVRVSVEPVPKPSAADSMTVEQQVWVIADYVNEMIQHDLGHKQNIMERELATVTEKEKQKHAD